MGLRDTFSKAAQTVFTAAGDIVEDAYYYSRGSTSYNASSGTTSVTDSRYLVSMIFSHYAAAQVDNVNVLNTDLLGLIPQANLPPVPTLHDMIRRIEAGASVEYAVLNIQQDAAAATLTFQLRKP